MAIAYLPSLGGVAKVSIKPNGEWDGESIGGAVVDRVRTNTAEDRGNYYVNEYANLGSGSTWFYKPATDFNFINGITLYRCIYIGADSRFGEKELLGSVNATVTHDGPSAADNSLQVDFISDGVYNYLESRNTLVLDNERDTTGKLSSESGWTDSYTSTTPLNPGQYERFWIRLRYTKDSDLADITGFNYYITIKDLTITVPRTSGRLNLSKVFTLDLSEKNLLLRSSLPQSFNIENIYKVIEHNGLTNIFYFDTDNNDAFTVLVVQRDSIVSDNKYIKIDLSSLVPNIMVDDTFYRNFSECCGTSPTSGTPATTGTSGQPTSGDPCVFKPLSTEYEDIIGSRFLLDIIGTQKEELNSFYIFFNKFLSSDSDRYVTTYGHKNYYWNTTVLNLDLNNINDVFFRNVEEGFLNTKTIVLSQQYEDTILEKFYTTDIILQDDLITGVGFTPEDCRVQNNRSKMWQLWEGNIVNRNLNVQTSYIPQIETSQLFTVPSQTSKEIDLIFDAELTDIKHFGWLRDIDTLNDGVQYVKMGPPHQNRLHHGYSEVSYDIDSNYDQFSTTWSFGVESDSVVVQTTGTTGTTGTPTTGTSGTSGTGITGQPTLNPNQYHTVLQSNFGDSGIADADLDYVDSDIRMFRLNCNGNVNETAIDVLYNWNYSKWSVIINDSDGNPVSIDITDGPVLGTSFENVITVNTYRQLDYGCYKRYIVQYSIHINGEELITGTTYTEQTTDGFVVTHNYNNDFSGWVSYWELRDYIVTDPQKYSEGMFRIFSNIAWGELETEVSNDSAVTGFKNFNYRRNIQIKNLNWEHDNSIVFPIVLQGTGYGIDSKYNLDVRRSVFDFKRIDINQKTFAFAYEGSDQKLQWLADTFDVESDMLTVWVRLENWNGQRITMYYSDSRLEPSEDEYNKPYATDYYAVWHMDSIQAIPRKRYVSQSIYEGGESLILTQDQDGNVYLLQIDKQYTYGYDQFYPSNKFDIQWDDRVVNRTNTEYIQDFIDSNVRKFKPNYMEIRNVESQFPYKLEIDNNNEIRGTTNAGLTYKGMVLPGPSRCRRL